jgi:nitrite reductase/ring-hydroxylating ferredoxin subunit
VKARIGSAAALQAEGRLTGKAGSQPICVVWHDDCAYAVDDRCPHLGFPLHRGTVENGLLTCHWHHARFDLVTGGTLDPFADDVRAYPVEIDGDDVYVVVEPIPDAVDHLRRRLGEGLEQGLTLVTAKAVLGLLDAGVEPAAVVADGVAFGTAYRQQGWGAGLTVLVAMANLLPRLRADDHALALVHGLAFVSRDTRGRPPRFALEPLGAAASQPDRLASWYRRFIETRADEAAERTLATAISSGQPRDVIATMMTAAATDHVFLDEGHVVDFTNKAFESLDHLGWDHAAVVLPSLVLQTAHARRHEEEGAWRHPHDLAAIIADFSARLPKLLEEGEPHLGSFTAVAELGWQLLADDPYDVAVAVTAAVVAGATPEQLGRALAFAAALRIVRFHTQNDHGDWDVVHHGFTTANALHQALVRAPSVELVRGVMHGALKVYLDRFLNVPAARLPGTPGAPAVDEPVSLDALQQCWDSEGGVDRAAALVHGWLRAGGSRDDVAAALGHALLHEDAEFHWFQTVEAAIRQAYSWPEGSDESALVLCAAARFLAAHTPTRRELAQVVRIATRLGRGEVLFEEA